MKSIKTITLIGAGNVATHIGKSFINNGLSVNEVCSKSQANASSLALKLNAKPCNNIAELNQKSDFYLICVNDDAIIDVVNQIIFTNKLIAHTSGSVSIDILNKFSNYGIFYPLQTFSKEKLVNMRSVPFCIEANNEKANQELQQLGSVLSNNIYQINSAQRKQIHLAAVFACNFSNYMYSIAEKLLQNNNIEFDILKPLIIETANKVLNNSPKDMQTGPAVRNDEAVIKNHLKMLADSEDYQDIYKIITQNIINNN